MFVSQSPRSDLSRTFCAGKQSTCHALTRIDLDWSGIVLENPEHPLNPLNQVYQVYPLAINGSSLMKVGLNGKHLQMVDMVGLCGFSIATITEVS